MTGNDFVAFFLRTPLYRLLGNTMLITVTGSKTGRKYSTPVGFYQEGDTLWVISNRNRTWWRNVRQGANVSLLLNGKAIRAFADTETEENAVEKHLLEYLRKIPMAARSFGIRVENKVPNTEDVARIARERLFIRIKPFSAETQHG